MSASSSPPSPSSWLTTTSSPAFTRGGQGHCGVPLRRAPLRRGNHGGQKRVSRPSPRLSCRQRENIPCRNGAGGGRATTEYLAAQHRMESHWADEAEQEQVDGLVCSVRRPAPTVRPVLAAQTRPHVRGRAPPHVRGRKRVSRQPATPSSPQREGVKGVHKSDSSCAVPDVTRA